MRPSKFVAIFKGVFRDWRSSAKFSADARSFFRLSIDFVLSRIVRILPKEQYNRPRQVFLRDGIKICYRLNKGDLHSIREVWFDEAYRLPFEDTSGILLDLGANIGLTSLWLAKRYPFKKLIAVEPDPNNAFLVRQNLTLNGIAGFVLEAAIGPKDGTARFKFSKVSNLGRLDENGSLVPMICVNSIVNNFGVDRFGLIKIDIEGAEKDLFGGPTEWLERTDAIIIEFHPACVDDSSLTRLVTSRGFKYIPAKSVFPENMDCFTRI
jgi:FkbM family methyltransferase